MNAQRDFSKKVLKGLAKNGITVLNSVAVPAFEGDKFFTGVAYQIVKDGQGMLRSYFEVEALAK